jgi:hypothetical protein
MEDVAAKIVVTVSEPGKTTVLSMQVGLPFMPPPGATFTVECGDEPLPLIVDHASYNISHGDLFVSTTLPSVERELADGRSQPLEASEMIAMLISAGFAIAEVWPDEEQIRSRRPSAPT